MAYLAVNSDGKEVRFDGKNRPVRGNGEWVQFENRRIPFESIHPMCRLCFIGTTVPFGTITAMTGQKLTWNDEPIKI